MAILSKIGLDGSGPIVAPTFASPFLRRDCTVTAYTRMAWRRDSPDHERLTAAGKPVVARNQMSQVRILPGVLTHCDRPDLLDWAVRQPFLHALNSPTPPTRFARLHRFYGLRRP